MEGLRARAGQVRCVVHCRHWCQGTSTLRLGGGRSLSQDLHHGSRSRCREEGGGPGGGPGGEGRGDGQGEVLRTSCLGAEGEVRAGEDDSLEVGGPCRAQAPGSRASEISGSGQIRYHTAGTSLPWLCSASRQGLEL